MQDNQKQISPQTWAKIETADGVKEQVEKFRFKSFYEKHKGAAAAAGAFGTVFLGLLSIGCAIMYVSEKIALAVGNFAVAALIAAIILVSIEILKTYALSGLFESFYYGKINHGTGKVNGALAVGCAVLIGISALLSVLGAESYTLASADKSVEISLQGNARIDSARAVFDAKIAALELSLQEINAGKAKRWGKLLTPSENQQILNIQARISETEAAKNAAVSEAKAGTESEIKETKTSAMSAATVGGLIAFGNETAIIFCAWFVWFFAYMVAREEKLKAANLAAGSVAANEKTDNVDNDIVIENCNGNGNGKLLNETKKGIGFNFGQKVANEPPAVPVNEPLSKKAADPVNEALANEPLTNEPLANEPLGNAVLSPPAGTIIVGKDYGNPPRLCKCGTWFHWKLAHKENCGSDCQVKSWETKTGKKIIPGRKR